MYLSIDTLHSGTLVQSKSVKVPSTLSECKVYVLVLAVLVLIHSLPI